MTNRDYYILKLEDITEDILKVAIQTSINTVRKTMDGNYGIIKIPSDQEKIIPQGYDKFTVEEMIEYIEVSGLFETGPELFLFN